MLNRSTDKNVYLLGAGFSKEIGLPLQDDFLLIAKEVYFRNPDKYKHFANVFEYQNKLAKMRTFLNYPLLNLEHLFNLLEMDIFYSNNEDVGNIKADFVQMIQDVLIELTPNPFAYDNHGNLRFNEKYNSHMEFLRLFIFDDQHIEHLDIYDDSIISFNYDLIFEAMVCRYNLERDRRRKNPPFGNLELIGLDILFEKQNLILDNLSNYFLGSNNSNNESLFATNQVIAANKKIKLIKLHGSINWKDSSDDSLFIVPPTWNKSDIRVRRLWEIAFKEITEAKRIIIIGYSFPETDIYVKSLLALALNENKILQNIYFINPDKDQVKSRCLSLLDMHFDKYCEYKAWTFSQFINSEEGKLFIREKLNRR